MLAIVALLEKQRSLILRVLILGVVTGVVVSTCLAFLQRVGWLTGNFGIVGSLIGGLLVGPVAVVMAARLRASRSTNDVIEGEGP